MRAVLALLMLPSLMLPALAATLPTAARADACGPRLVVSFVEDAADVFVLQNASNPGWAVQRVEIDLRESGGGLPGGTQTWIDGGEIAGGRVHAVFAGPDGTTAERSADFERDSRADTGRHENCLMS